MVLEAQFFNRLDIFCCLIDRKLQSVKRLSTWTEVLCGVPHVSVLGPVLFVYYINDMPVTRISVCRRAKISSKICCRQDMEQLQLDLNRLGDWSRKVASTVQFK